MNINTGLFFKCFQVAQPVYIFKQLYGCETGIAIFITKFSRQIRTLLINKIAGSHWKSLLLFSYSIHYLTGVIVCGRWNYRRIACSAPGDLTVSQQ